MLFGTIFAVTPDRDDPTTMLVHSLPYLNLKIGMCVLQVAVVWFGAKVTWKNSKVSKGFITLSWFHVVLQWLTMVISNPFLVNSLGNMGPENLKGKGLWWDVHNNETIGLVISIT